MKLETPRATPDTPRMAAVALSELVAYCNQRLGLPGYPDYPPALNGLQLENNGQVARIGAAVDAGLLPFERAIAGGVEFLIVHHGLFWDGARPIVGAQRERLRVALTGNLAVYSAHLPLDAHPEIGNNVLLARAVGLEPTRTFLPYGGRDAGLVAKHSGDRAALRARLEALFPGGVTALEFGSTAPREIAVLTGSGMSAVEPLGGIGVDTLITGELKQSVYNHAQEQRLNLYLCGHYATEVYGVRTLAAELAEKFSLPWSWVGTECPL